MNYLNIKKIKHALKRLLHIFWNKAFHLMKIKMKKQKSGQQMILRQEINQVKELLEMFLLQDKELLALFV